MRVYYLTQLQHGLSNIALHRLKISRYSSLNDPFEFLAVDLSDKRHREAFRKTKEEVNKDNGLICFARKWSNPLMWGHYANGHTGIALGFDIKDEFLTPVIYAKTPMKIRVNPKTGRPILTQDIMDKLIRTKFHDWKYEDELRLFVKLDHSTVESGMYFKPFDSDLILREVILGPRCELPIASIRSMIGSFSPSVKVVKSRIAFSSFRVIRNIVATRT